MRRNRILEIAALSLTMLVILFLAEITFGARVEEEARVKTAYIYNFCKYVTWPDSASDAPLDICVLGQNPIVEQIAMLTKKKIKSRNIVVKFQPSCSSMQCCDVLFISGTETETLTTITASKSTLPVLTISDTEGFAKQGGMIELVKQGNKIRFIINKNRLDEANLTISSRLLKLATIVNGEED
jgi:hypothetical protein